MNSTCRKIMIRNAISLLFMFNMLKTNRAEFSQIQLD